MKRYVSPEELEHRKKARNTSARRRKADSKPFQPSDYSFGPHAKAAHAAGGTLIGIPFNRHKFDAEVKAYAPGCSSPFYPYGEEAGAVRCGARIGNKRVFCPHCETAGIHERKAVTVVRTLLEKETDRYVGIVVLRNREDPEALVIKRGGEPMKGKWACPGGHVDTGESDRNAAYRELEEETGIEADEMHQFEEDDVDIGHLTFFWTQVPSSTRAKADDDAEKAKWVKVSDLPELAWENARQIRDACERFS